MADLKLSFAMTAYDRILPLINGEVKPDGITLDYMGMPGDCPRVFYEQIKFQRYDISEMSISSALRMLSIGWPYLLLPVFHNRNFTYTKIYIHKRSGIRQNHPEDLKGKCFGIRDYQQSLGLWTRGILKMEFNVNPYDIIWYQERGKHFSHTGASSEAGLALPKELNLNYMQTDIHTMLTSGELDAYVSLNFDMGIANTTGIDRQCRSHADDPNIITLFSDPKGEAIRFFKKTGVFPPHHVTVVRKEILQQHPWVAISLMEAFEESKKIAAERLLKLQPTLLVFGDHYLRETTDIFGPDPYAYGLKSNSHAFEMVQNYSVDQGLTKRKQPFEEIFPQEIIYREEKT